MRSDEEERKSERPRQEEFDSIEASTNLPRKALKSLSVKRRRRRRAWKHMGARQDESGSTS